MSKTYTYRTLIVPSAFSVKGIFEMIKEVDDYNDEFANMIYVNFENWVQSVDRYDLNDDEVENLSLFELDKAGQERYKKALIAKSYLKEAIVSLLSPIAYKTYKYGRYKSAGIIKEENFYIITSGGEGYGEDPNQECAGIRCIKAMNFEQLRLK